MISDGDYRKLFELVLVGYVIWWPLKLKRTVCILLECCLGRHLYTIRKYQSQTLLDSALDIMAVPYERYEDEIEAQDADNSSQSEEENEPSTSAAPVSPRMAAKLR